MRFFIPGVSSSDEAERLYEATRKFAESTMGRPIAQRRILRIRYKHDGKDFEAEVGQPCPRIGETVMAILESDPYLVCTMNRGVARGMPVLVGQNEVRHIDEFDPPA